MNNHHGCGVKKHLLSQDLYGWRRRKKKVIECYTIRPPEYRKPHDLKKQWKVTVLVAVIKNLEPDFEQIRKLVCEAQTVKNKMTHKENRIWLAVIRGEEMKMRGRLQLFNPESILYNGDVKALDNSSTESSIGGIADKETEICLVPSPVIKDGSEGIADKEVEVLPSSSMNGERSGANKFKRIATVEAQKIPIRSLTFSQGPILEAIRIATLEGETSKRQKLKGIAIADNGISKLPNYQSGICRGSSIFSQGSMNSNKMLHPFATNYHLCNGTLHPSPTPFAMPCAMPGHFRVPTSLGSNNNQLNSFNYGGQMSNVNQANPSSSSGQKPTANQVNFSNFGGQISNNNQVYSSNFGGQISNYLNSTTNGMSMGSLNMPSIPQGSNFAQPIQRTSAVDSTIQNFELEGMNFDFTPFEDVNLTSDFNFDLDSFTGGEDSEDDASAKWK